MSVNRAILIGFVDSPIHISELHNGSKVANFILVTTERWRDGKTGDQRSKQERHKIAVFSDKIVTFLGTSVKQGAVLYVEGQLEARSWSDPQNMQQQSVDVVVRPGRGTITVVEKNEEPRPQPPAVQ